MRREASSSKGSRCLTRRALKGEEVTIAKAGHPVVRLTPIQVSKPTLGSARGLVSMQPGWAEAMTPEEVEETLGW